jgi:hypothetical protein
VCGTGSVLESLETPILGLVPDLNAPHAVAGRVAIAVLEVIGQERRVLAELVSDLVLVEAIVLVEPVSARFRKHANVWFLIESRILDIGLVKHAAE